jgi:putative spermidine/putrescine transport system substrate-binding protein
LAGIALASNYLTGCQATPPQILRVRSLKNSLPPQIVSDFIKSIERSPRPEVELAAEPQIPELLELLKTWQTEGKAEAKGFKLPFFPASRDAKYIPDVVSMGDTWLPEAIASKSIQAIDDRNPLLNNLGKLDPSWLELVRRDDRGLMSKEGKIWGLPYRWGTMSIIYRRDLLEQNKLSPPKDWADLWLPEYKQRISILDDPRASIGIGLKKIGQSLNAKNIDRLRELPPELAKLHRQVKFYSSDYYLQSLAIGDTWIAVGWSNDIIDLVAKNANYGAIVPPAGTALWADLWVLPRLNGVPDADRSKLAYQWIDYSWNPQNTDRLAVYAASASPILKNTQPSSLISNLQQISLILPPKETLDRSEFLHPLDRDNYNIYLNLWRQMRMS